MKKPVKLPDDFEQTSGEGTPRDRVWPLALREACRASGRRGGSSHVSAEGKRWRAAGILRHPEPTQVEGSRSRARVPTPRRGAGQ